MPKNSSKTEKKSKASLHSKVEPAIPERMKEGIGSLIREKTGLISAKIKFGKYTTEKYQIEIEHQGSSVVLTIDDSHGKEIIRKGFLY